MPRPPRALLVGPGSTNHCVWRAHNLSHVFDSDEARAEFLGLLRLYKKQYGIEVQSYCLMGTHPHVMCRSPRGQKEFSAFWQSVNGAFARWYNKKMKRRGQVVMERLRSPQIQDGRHQLNVMRYGDLNPVRARLVSSPARWKWSSYRHYAFGEEDDLITDAPEYQALGDTPAQRRKAYLHLFARPLAREFLVSRPDMVLVCFVGDEGWVQRRHRATGIPLPDDGPTARA